MYCFESRRVLSTSITKEELKEAMKRESKGLNERLKKGRRSGCFDI